MLKKERRRDKRAPSREGAGGLAKKQAENRNVVGLQIGFIGQKC